MPVVAAASLAAAAARDDAATAYTFADDAVVLARALAPARFLFAAPPPLDRGVGGAHPGDSNGTATPEKDDAAEEEDGIDVLDDTPGVPGGGVLLLGLARLEWPAASPSGWG